MTKGPILAKQLIHLVFRIVRREVGEGAERMRGRKRRRDEGERRGKNGREGETWEDGKREEGWRQG